MKEYNGEFDDDYNFNNYNNIKEEKFGQSSDFNQNEIISPFRSQENSPINNNNRIELEEETKKFNSYNLKNKSIFNDEDTTINDHLQFVIYPLNDEQKKYLTPRNTTIVYKILDFLFNW